MTDYIIDIEPTWEAILKGVESGALKAEALRPVCKIADMIRRAQKDGKKSITFSFEGKDTIVTEVA